MEETINLKELLELVRRRLLLIVLLGISLMTIAGVVSFFVLTPMYQTSTELIVNNAMGGDQLTNVDIQTSLNLINTYREIITRPRILNSVIEELGLDVSVTALQSLVTASNNANSQILVITVRHEDPIVARDIANKIAEVFKDNIGDIMNIADNVSILTPAELMTTPVEPRPTLNMAVGLVVGLVLGIGLTFAFDYLDTKVRTEQDVKKLLDLPIIGVIPDIKSRDFRKDKLR